LIARSYVLRGVVVVRYGWGASDARSLCGHGQERPLEVKKVTIQAGRYAERNAFGVLSGKAGRWYTLKACLMRRCDVFSIKCGKNTF